MKVSDRVRISYANLMRLSDHFEMILCVKKVRDIRKSLLGFDSTDVVHALAINDYCRRHSSAVSRLVKQIGVDQAFFEIARDVLGRRESLDNIASAEAVLKELRSVIDRQKEVLDDLARLGADEFKHLQDWGLKHDIGRKKNVHVLEFAKKIEKKIRWSDDDKVNAKKIFELVSSEKDHHLRDLHLYIVFLLELKRYYGRLRKIFDEQLKVIGLQESAVMKLKKEPFGTAIFHRHAKDAFDKSKALDKQVMAEAGYLGNLVRVMKDIRRHFPVLVDHHIRNSSPFIHVLGHPVQVESYDEKHPERISLPKIMQHFNTEVIVFGEDHEFCHVLLHHSAKIHFSVVSSKKGYFLFNQEGSPGTFVIRGKEIFSVAHNPIDKSMLQKRMDMFPKDYSHITGDGKNLSVKLSAKGFLLSDGDQIIVPSGYRFIFSSSKAL